MMVVDIDGVLYHRLILESVSPEDTARLKSDFDYSFIVSMGDFQDEDYDVVEKKSCIIDLSKDIDRIVGAFSSTSRNEYRRSERIEKLEFHAPADPAVDFSNYYAFYTACENDREWFPVPPQEFAASLIFTATFEGSPISGMSCYGHERRLRVSRIYSSKRTKRSESLNNTLYGSAAKRIVVEICKYGITNGYKTLDLGGVDLEDGIKSGISQFKLSLGGEIVDVKLGRFMRKSFAEKRPSFRARGWDIT